MRHGLFFCLIGRRMSYSQLWPKAGGYTAVKRYHSAQVQSLHWCLRLDKSTASKVLLHFEYTERQGLCLQISLGGSLSSAGVQAASPSCVSWQWGVLAVWVSLQEKFWAAQPAWSQSHSTAAEIKGRFEGCQASAPTERLMPSTWKCSCPVPLHNLIMWPSLTGCASSATVAQVLAASRMIFIIHWRSTVVFCLAKVSLSKVLCSFGEKGKLQQSCLCSHWLITNCLVQPFQNL